MRGDGRDVIADSGGNTDVLDLRGYRPDELRVTLPVETRDDLLVTFVGTDDEILLRAGSGGRVDLLRFGDGTERTWADLEAATVGQGTPNADLLTGSSLADRLEGGPGYDMLKGLQGSDTYVFTRGDGRDQIDDGGPTNEANRLILNDYGPGDVTVVRHADRPDDLVLRLQGGDEITILRGFATTGGRITAFEFADGTVWSMTDILLRLESQRDPTRDEVLIGTSGPDTMVGGGGDDDLTGLGGNDTYVFVRGDGHDLIRDQGSSFGNPANLLEIRGYTRDQVQFGFAPGSRSDLQITFADTTDRIRLIGTLGNSASDFVQAIRLTADGSLITLDQVRAQLMAAQVSPGDDLIFGAEGSETTEAGPGDDRILSGGGIDSLIFTRGDGRDTVIGSQSNQNLTLHGYVPGEVIVAADPQQPLGAILSFVGSTDQIRIYDASGGEGPLQSITFDNGVVWDRAELDARRLALAGTPGNDEIFGSYGTETIAAGPGDDLISSSFGGDVIVYAAGDGRDTVLETYSAILRLTDLDPSDIVVLGPVLEDGSLTVAVTGSRDQIRFVLGTTALERIEFADGTVWNASQIAAAITPRPATGAGPVTLTGTSGADSFASTPAQEIFEGGSGADTYRYTPGSGHDLIIDYGFSTGQIDTLDLSDFGLADLRFAREMSGQTDLVVTFAGAEGSITIRDQLGNFGGIGIERILLAGGGELDREAIAALVPLGASVRSDLLIGTEAAGTLDGLGGDDTIEGRGGDDSLIGGIGDDVLAGGEGADTYHVAPGDGADAIIDNQTLNLNRLVLTGTAAADLEFGWNPLASRVVLGFAGRSDSITFSSFGYDYAGYEAAFVDFSFGQIRLDDGTVLTDADVLALLQLPDMGQIYGEENR